VSRDLDVDVQALTYLVTVLIHRLRENDPTWWQEFRDEVELARIVSSVGSVKAKVLERTIGLLERAFQADEQS